MPTNPTIVDLSNRRTEIAADGSQVTTEEDGTIVVEEGGKQRHQQDADAGHFNNLAGHLTESERAMIANDLIQAFERDREARAEWDRRLAEGMRIIGYVKDPDIEIPFKGASSAVYPLIAEAIIQFSARAEEELYPASGPVKTIVVSDKTPEKEEQAQRVEEYMNYQITEEDPSWQDEDDRLLARLPMDGMGYKKVYRDERMGIQTSKFVAGTDVFAPYSATTTHSTPRLCHRQEWQPNDVRFQQIIGNWLDVPLGTPIEAGADEQSETQRAIDEAEGVEPSMEDRVYEVLEFYVDYDLPQFEHVSDKDNEPTRFKLPYIITIEKVSGQVLAIYRNWKENDERYRKRINLIPYRFLLGPGYYGLGFPAAIGGLNAAATGSMRALLDSAARNNLPSGFIAKDAAGLKGGEYILTPGEYTPVDVDAETLRNAIVQIPFHPPSEALFKMLGLIVEAGKSYTSTTEAMTGAGSTTGPVGTTLALIEQGSKVFSGIHKRLHRAKRAEYKLLSELNGEYIPEEGYPYEVGETSREIFARDFGPEVDVLPVSDPNIYSSHQRIAMSQATLELSLQAPDLYDRREVHRRMLAALKTPNIDEILMPEDEPEVLDPVTENMRVMTGQAVHAAPEQNHDAHIQVHMAFLQHPGFGGHPDVQKLIAPIMAAHMAEHTAYLYQQRMVSTGVPYIPVDLSEPRADEDDEFQLEPEEQDQIAMMAAMASDPFMQTTGLPPMPDPQQAAAEAEQAKAEAELALQREKAQVDMQVKQADQQLRQASATADEARKQQAFAADEARKQASWEAEEARKARSFAAEEAREEEAAKQDLDLSEEKARSDQKLAAARAKPAKPAAKKSEKS